MNTMGPLSSLEESRLEEVEYHAEVGKHSFRVPTNANICLWTARRDTTSSTSPQNRGLRCRAEHISSARITKSSYHSSSGQYLATTCPKHKIIYRCLVSNSRTDSGAMGEGVVRRKRTLQQKTHPPQIKSPPNDQT